MSRKAWSKGRVDMGGGLVRSIEADGKLKSKGISTTRLLESVLALCMVYGRWLLVRISYVDMMWEVLVRGESISVCMNKDQGDQLREKGQDETGSFWEFVRVQSQNQRDL
jgi:hypothetical protein